MAINGFYPDLVGAEVLNKNWVREIKECVKVYSDRKTKLWSFEVKLKINRSKCGRLFSKRLAIHLGQTMAILLPVR